MLIVLISFDLKFVPYLLIETADETEALPDEANAPSDEANAPPSRRKSRDISEELFEPRPLRVTFSDVDSKIKLMKGVHKLSQHDVPDELLSISVKHDLTVEERKQEKELRKRVKSLNANNPSKNSKHVIMEPPWERHIGMLQKKGNSWVPVRNSQNKKMRGEVHILLYCPIDTLQWGSTHSAMSDSFSI